MRLLDFFDGTRYLVLLSPEKYNAIYNRIRYLIEVTISILYLISHNSTKI